MSVAFLSFDPSSRRRAVKGTVPLGVAFTLDGVTTSVLDYDASAGDVTSELNGLARVGQNVQGDGGLVLVDRRLTSTNRGRGWYERRVAFPTSARDASALFADGAGPSDTAAAINVMTRTNGEFAPLQFGTVTDYTRRATFCLVSYDASAAALEAALKNLTRVGDVVVTRRCRSEYGSAGYEWNVTFTTLGAPTHAGAVQLLRVASASRLEGTRPVAAQHVDEVVAGYGPSVALERSVNGQQYASDQLLFEYHEPILVGAAVAPTLGLSGGGGGGRESILGGGGGASAGQRGLVGSAAAVVGVLWPVSSSAEASAAAVGGGAAAAAAAAAAGASRRRDDVQRAARVGLRVLRPGRRELYLHGHHLA